MDHSTQTAAQANTSTPTEDELPVLVEEELYGVSGGYVPLIPIFIDTD